MTSPASAVPGDAPPRVVEDCLGILQLLSDGTVPRAVFPLVLPGTSSDTTSPVQWKDVAYDETRGLSLRMYVPSTGAGEKLPVMVYFHCGGFCLGSFAMPDAHAACLRLAAELQMWRLALPAGASRDHPASNPFGPESPALEGVKLPPVLVAVGDRDMLVDRIKEYVARLKAADKSVELVEFAGQGHGFAMVEPRGEAAGELVRVVRRLVHSAALN
ncbi:unnamed protein product [Alopecurus aequalis]